MIDRPSKPADHPDRGIDCELAAEGEFRAFVDRIEAAGWTGDEAASVLLSLALNYARFRKEAAAAELRIETARRRASS